MMRMLPLRYGPPLRVRLDLLCQRIAMLGVEVRVERRLAAGDMSLRSWLLATPVGARLYKLSRGHQSEVQPLPSGKAS